MHGSVLPEYTIQLRLELLRALPELGSWSIVRPAGVFETQLTDDYRLRVAAKNRASVSLYTGNNIRCGGQGVC